MQKYGIQWKDELDELEIEFQCIRYGGKWKSGKTGEECGKGLFHHYKAAMTLMWPEDEWQRWAELGLREMIQNKFTVFLGPASSGKTYGAAKFALVEYFLYPESTMVVVSSTEGRGLELRIWGKMKDMHTKAKRRFEWIPGKIIDYLKCISTDQLEKSEGKMEGRVLNRGVICIPVKIGGVNVGMSAYVGAKSARFRLVADELQFVGDGFLESVANLTSNPDFKMIAMGNPKDELDPLGVVAEPKSGWATHPEPTKTTVWDCKWRSGRCVNFVGTDSPNFDYSQNRAPKYPYLINKDFIEENAQVWTRESAMFYQQCIGVMKPGMMSRRVITKDLCKIHKTDEKVIWKGTPRKRLCALDAAYTGVGGDRCVIMWGEFGDSISGAQVLRLNQPLIIPISVSGEITPEDQIANYVKGYIESFEIEPDQVFYDSTGRGTLGTAFSKAFEYMKKKPVPVEFGGSPSERPVKYDYFTVENGIKRLVRCSEYYSDKVSELWMSTRYAIEADQIKELPVEIMEEGCQREYGEERGKKTFVESKHDKRARQRMKVSPDLYDCFATLLEGARQMGFQIRRIGVEVGKEDEQVADVEAERHNRLFRGAISGNLLQTSSSPFKNLPWKN